MSDEWCPENDGAYQAEMAALHRDGVEHRVHKARAEIEAAARKLEGFLDAVREASSGSDYRVIFMDGAAEALAQAIP